MGFAVGRAGRLDGRTLHARVTQLTEKRRVGECSKRRLKWRAGVPISNEWGARAEAVVMGSIDSRPTTRPLRNTLEIVTLSWVFGSVWQTTVTGVPL
jgi:hypothetical protein